MRIIHHPVGTDAVDLSWTFHTAPARSGALFVLCCSMLVGFHAAKPTRKETLRSAAHRMAPRKSAGDFLVSGNAVVPTGGQPRQGLRVAIQLDGARKELAVFGDRQWRSGPLGLSATEPEPFDSIPITWDRAFGGSGESRNPTGCGYGPGERGRRLPNVEYLDRRVTQPTSRPEPAGFGPVDAQWQPRLGKLGTFDDSWLSDNWPLMPDDFDPGYWNEAPTDQQFPGYFRGDEQLTFENMQADSPRLDWQLPGLRVRAFGELANGRIGEFRLALDTIDVDVNAGQAELVWRSALPVRSVRFKELVYLFTLAEPVATPTDEVAWRAMFLAARRARYPTPEEKAAATAASHVADEAAAADRADKAEAIRAPALAALAAAQARATAAAGAQTVTAAPPDPQAGRQATEAAFARARENAPERAAELDAGLATLLEAQDRLAQRGKKWTRERVIAAYQAADNLAEADLSGLDLTGLDLTGARMSRARFTGARLGGSLLRRAALAGCDFAQIDAEGADFSGAALDEAIFCKAALNRSVFTDAGLNRTNFAGARAQSTVFYRAHGINARFDSAELHEATFREAQLPRASFARAHLDQVLFDGAILTKADFAGAAGAQVSFRDADLGNLRAPDAALPGATFSGASAARSVWRMARLEGADFSHAHLTRAIFAEAEIGRALFDRAILVDANFDDALMQHAVLTNANLLRASFARADLRDADLRGANLYRAGLFGARAARVRFDGSFLAGTLLAS